MKFPQSSSHLESTTTLFDIQTLNRNGCRQTVFKLKNNILRELSLKQQLKFVEELIDSLAYKCSLFSNVEVVATNRIEIRFPYYEKYQINSDFRHNYFNIVTGLLYAINLTLQLRKDHSSSYFEINENLFFKKDQQIYFISLPLLTQQTYKDQLSCIKIILKKVQAETIQEKIFLKKLDKCQNLSEIRQQLSYFMTLTKLKTKGFPNQRLQERKDQVSIRSHYYKSTSRKSRNNLNILQFADRTLNFRNKNTLYCNSLRNDQRKKTQRSVLMNNSFMSKGNEFLSRILNFNKLIKNRDIINSQSQWTENSYVRRDDICSETQTDNFFPDKYRDSFKNRSLLTLNKVCSIKLAVNTTKKTSILPELQAKEVSQQIKPKQLIRKASLRSGVLSITYQGFQSKYHNCQLLNTTQQKNQEDLPFDSKITETEIRRKDGKKDFQRHLYQVQQQKNCKNILNQSSQQKKITNMEIKQNQEQLNLQEVIKKNRKVKRSYLAKYNPSNKANKQNMTVEEQEKFSIQSIKNIKNNRQKQEKQENNPYNLKPKNVVQNSKSQFNKFSQVEQKKTQNEVKQSKEKIKKHHHSISQTSNLINEQIANQQVNHINQVNEALDKINFLGQAVVFASHFHKTINTKTFWQLPLFFIYKYFLSMRLKIEQKFCNKYPGQKYKKFVEGIGNENKEIENAVKKMLVGILKKLKKQPYQQFDLNPYLNLDLTMQSKMVAVKFNYEQIIQLPQFLADQQDTLTYCLHIVNSLLIILNQPVDLGQHRRCLQNPKFMKPYYNKCLLKLENQIDKFSAKQKL